jgi:hypothetical protein
VVGGPWDWYSFSAEAQIDGAAPMVVSTFDVAPMELFPPGTARHESGVAEPWNPADEPAFLKIPVEYQTMFALMVFDWGRLASAMVPTPARLASAMVPAPARLASAVVPVPARLTVH